MTMKIGDRVEVLDEVIAGVVDKIEGNRVSIETDEGFPMLFSKDELVVVHDFRVDQREVKQALKDKKAGLRKPKKPVREKTSSRPPMVIDLHIQELTGSTKNMSHFDMLNLQLDTAKNRLNFAIKKHIQKLVFIHGVGKGVLRMELETLLRRYDQVEFYDADFARYGRGATEVRIYQNP